VKRALALLLLLVCAAGQAAAPWTLRFDGIGPLATGMSFDAANSALHGILRRTPAANNPWPACDYIQVPDHPGLALLFIDDKLARIEVTGASRLATSAGLRIGMPTAAVRRAYPGVAVEPEAYDHEMHYLTVHAPDGEHALRFVTGHDGRIQYFYTGDWSAVQLVEYCD
jgi:hypothetical protein